MFRNAEMATFCLAILFIYLIGKPYHTIFFILFLNLTIQVFLLNIFLIVDPSYFSAFNAEYVSLISKLNQSQVKVK